MDSDEYDASSAKYTWHSAAGSRGKQGKGTSKTTTGTTIFESATDGIETTDTSNVNIGFRQQNPKRKTNKPKKVRKWPSDCSNAMSARDMKVLWTGHSTASDGTNPLAKTLSSNFSENRFGIFHKLPPNEQLSGISLRQYGDVVGLKKATKAAKEQSSSSFVENDGKNTSNRRRRHPWEELASNLKFSKATSTCGLGYCNTNKKKNKELNQGCQAKITQERQKKKILGNVRSDSSVLKGGRVRRKNQSRILKTAPHKGRSHHGIHKHTKLLQELLSAASTDSQNEIFIDGVKKNVKDLNDFERSKRRRRRNKKDPNFKPIVYKPSDNALYNATCNERNRATMKHPRDTKKPWPFLAHSEDEMNTRLGVEKGIDLQLPSAQIFKALKNQEQFKKDLLKPVRLKAGDTKPVLTTVGRLVYPEGSIVLVGKVKTAEGIYKKSVVLGTLRNEGEVFASPRGNLSLASGDSMATIPISNHGEDEKSDGEEGEVEKEEFFKPTNIYNGSDDVPQGKSRWSKLGKVTGGIKRLRRLSKIAIQPFKLKKGPAGDMVDEDIIKTEAEKVYGGLEEKKSAVTSLDQAIDEDEMNRRAQSEKLLIGKRQVSRFRNGDNEDRFLNPIPVSDSDPKFIFTTHHQLKFDEKFKDIHTQTTKVTEVNIRQWRDKKPGWVQPVPEELRAKPGVENFTPWHQTIAENGTSWLRHCLFILPGYSRTDILSKRYKKLAQFEIDYGMFLTQGDSFCNSSIESVDEQIIEEVKQDGIMAFNENSTTDDQSNQTQDDESTKQSSEAESEDLSQSITDVSSTENSSEAYSDIPQVSTGRGKIKSKFSKDYDEVTDENMIVIGRRRINYEVSNIKTPPIGRYTSGKGQDGDTAVSSENEEKSPKNVDWSSHDSEFSLYQKCLRDTCMELNKQKRLKSRHARNISAKFRMITSMDEKVQVGVPSIRAGPSIDEPIYDETPPESTLTPKSSKTEHKQIVSALQPTAGSVNSDASGDYSFHSAIGPRLSMSLPVNRPNAQLNEVREVTSARTNLNKFHRSGKDANAGSSALKPVDEVDSEAAIKIPDRKSVIKLQNFFDKNNSSDSTNSGIKFGDRFKKPSLNPSQSLPSSFLDSDNSAENAKLCEMHLPKKYLQLRPSDRSSTDVSGVTTWFDQNSCANSFNCRASSDDSFQAVVGSEHGPIKPRIVKCNYLNCEKFKNYDCNKALKSTLMYLRGDGIVLKRFLLPDGKPKVKPKFRYRPSLRFRRRVNPDQSDCHLNWEKYAIQFPEGTGDQWNRLRYDELKEMMNKVDTVQTRLGHEDCPLKDYQFRPFFLDLYTKNYLYPIAAKIVDLALMEGSEKYLKLYPPYTEKQLEKCCESLSYEIIVKGIAKYLVTDSINDYTHEIQSHNIFHNLLKEVIKDLVYFECVKFFTDDVISQGRRLLIIDEFLKEHNGTESATSVESKSSVEIGEGGSQGKGKFSCFCTPFEGEDKMKNNVIPVRLPTIEGKILEDRFNPVDISNRIAMNKDVKRILQKSVANYVTDKQIEVEVRELMNEMISTIVISEKLNLDLPESITNRSRKPVKDLPAIVEEDVQQAFASNNYASRGRSLSSGSTSSLSTESTTSMSTSSWSSNDAPQPSSGLYRRKRKTTVDGFTIELRKYSSSHKEVIMGRRKKSKSFFSMPHPSAGRKNEKVFKTPPKALQNRFMPLSSSLSSAESTVESSDSNGADSFTNVTSSDSLSNVTSSSDSEEYCIFIPTNINSPYPRSGGNNDGVCEIEISENITQKYRMVKIGRDRFNSTEKVKCLKSQEPKLSVITEVEDSLPVDRDSSIKGSPNPRSGNDTTTVVLNFNELPDHGDKENPDIATRLQMRLKQYRDSKKAEFEKTKDGENRTTLEVNNQRNTPLSSCSKTTNHLYKTTLDKPLIEKRDIREFKSYETIKDLNAELDAVYKAFGSGSRTQKSTVNRKNRSWASLVQEFQTSLDQFGELLAARPFNKRPRAKNTFKKIEEHVGDSNEITESTWVTESSSAESKISTDSQHSKNGKNNQKTPIPSGAIDRENQTNEIMSPTQPNSSRTKETLQKTTIREKSNTTDSCRTNDTLHKSTEKMTAHTSNNLFGKDIPQQTVEKRHIEHSDSSLCSGSNPTMFRTSESFISQFAAGPYKPLTHGKIAQFPRSPSDESISSTESSDFTDKYLNFSKTNDIEKEVDKNSASKHKTTLSKKCKAGTSVSQRSLSPCNDKAINVTPRVTTQTSARLHQQPVSNRQGKVNANSGTSTNISISNVKQVTDVNSWKPHGKTSSIVPEGSNTLVSDESSLSEAESLTSVTSSSSPNSSESSQLCVNYAVEKVPLNVRTLKSKLFNAKKYKGCVYTPREHKPMTAHLTMKESENVQLAVPVLRNFFESFGDIQDNGGRSFEIYSDLDEVPLPSAKGPKSETSRKEGKSKKNGGKVKILIDRSQKPPPPSDEDSESEEANKEKIKIRKVIHPDSAEAPPPKPFDESDCRKLLTGELGCDFIPEAFFPKNTCCRDKGCQCAKCIMKQACSSAPTSCGIHACLKTKPENCLGCNPENPLPNCHHTHRIPPESCNCAKCLKTQECGWNSTPCKPLCQQENCLACRPKKKKQMCKEEAKRKWGRHKCDDQKRCVCDDPCTRSVKIRPTKHFNEINGACINNQQRTKRLDVVFEDGLSEDECVAEHVVKTCNFLQGISSTSILPHSNECRVRDKCIKPCCNETLNCDDTRKRAYSHKYMVPPAIFIRRSTTYALGEDIDIGGMPAHRHVFLFGHM